MTSSRPEPSPARRLHDFVVVSDHLPVDHAAPAAAAHRTDPAAWRSSPGGLNAALQPVVAERHGAWVGWNGLPGTATEPFLWEDMWLHPVPLSAREIAEHVDGQCNATISPLYHDAVEPPAFHRRWRQAYRAVNQRYARTAADVAAPGGVVWIHDYHLQLVPAMLRELRPDLLIGFFLHIPFPPVELFNQLPLRAEVVNGLLGADLVGFQRPRAVENFLELVRQLTDHPVEHRTVVVDGRRVSVEAFPLSIDVDTAEHLVADPAIRQRATEIRTELGRPRTVLLAVDRLDPAKGIEQRLTAFGELLTERRIDPADTVLVQVAVPSRQRSPHHQTMRDRIEHKVGEINGAHSQVGRPAVHYLHQTLDRDELTALYLAADVMLATPLRDGMNLPAKEYVASRTDDTGTLVLSEFTGAAADFPQAVIVNPHDVDALKEAILLAAARQGVDGTAMHAMREHLRRHDVHLWAGRFLASLGGCAARSAVPRQAEPTNVDPANIEPANIEPATMNDLSRSG